MNEVGEGSLDAYLSDFERAGSIQEDEVGMVEVRSRKCNVNSYKFEPCIAGESGLDTSLQKK